MGFFYLISLLAAWKRVADLHKSGAPVETFWHVVLAIWILISIIWICLGLWKWKRLAADWKENR
jgi:heme/copper-type cytochrome/quinol oxidase subunit 3